MLRTFAATPATRFRVQQQEDLMPLNIGDDAKLELQIDVNGVLTDPGALSLVVKAPSAAAVTYTYPSAEVARVVTGKFRGIIPCTEAGLWRYRWVATGTGKGVEEGSFTVVANSF